MLRRDLILMDIKPEIEKIVNQINYEAKSRAFRVSNELRNAALTVLRGERSGRVYKKPGTYGRRMTKQTKELLKEYGHKLRGGQLYRASAPGEPPANRTGNFRLSWRQTIGSEKIGKDLTIKPAIITNVKYATWLEDGTEKMKPRPFKEPIIEKAMPRIKKIYREPYLDK